MRIIEDIETIGQPLPSVLTVGTYDGFHLGHQSVLDLMKKIALKNKLQTVVVTFEPHPRKVLTGESVPILTTLREKLQIFDNNRIDLTVVIPFTLSFARLSSREFVQQILVEHLAVKEIVIGYDHHFGRNREGGFENLQQMGKELGFGAHQASPVTHDDDPVSSTRIRHLVEAGEMQSAASLLGHLYGVFGTVVRGNGRGRTLGYPTANILLDDPDKLIPRQGVYAVDVHTADGHYKGMMNIGTRPTFDYDRLTLEVHLFNFRGSLYNQVIEVRLKQFIRPEIKFDSIDALTDQLEKDRTISEKL